MIQGSKRLYILLAAILTMMVAVACSGDSIGSEGITLVGRGLTMNVKDVQRVDSLTYQDVDNIYYSVGPVQPGHELLVARVTIWNDRSGKLSLFIDGEAATLEGVNREQAFAIDPYQRRQSLESAPPDLGRHVPFLWGPSELPQGFNITGWMAFEVPADLEIRIMRWDYIDLLTFPVSVK